MSTQNFDQASTEVKLAFLESALQKDSQLQQEFESFLKSRQKSMQRTINDPEAFIAEIAQILREELEGLNISDPDWEHYTPRHSGYIPEYEAAEHMAEDQVEEVMEGFFNDMEKHGREKRFDKAVLVAIGCYDACLTAQLENEHETLPDPEEFLLSTLKQILEKLNNLLEMTTVPDDQLYTITWALLNHARKHYNEDPGFLHFFETFMLTFATGKAQAFIVRQAINEMDLPPENIPQLITKVGKLLDGHEAWEKAALKLFTANKNIAGELLELYRQKDKEKFILIANELWQKDTFRKDFANLYFDTLQPSDHPSLYKEVILHLTDQRREEKYYIALMGLLNDDERQTFREKYAWDRKFYVLMLYLEGRHEEALDYIDKKTDYRDLAELIGYFTGHLPTRCFKLISEKTYKTIQRERGRHAYENIIAALKVALKIQGYEDAAHQLARELYNWKPRLPTLRKELQAAGFEVG